MKKIKVRVVFKDNSYMNSCGFDHTIECDYYYLTKDSTFLVTIENDVETFIPISNIVLFDDLSKLIKDLT